MTQRLNRSYTNTERLQAFVLFLEKGSLEPVKVRYPQHVAFVEVNKNKTYQEVKDLCLGLVYHS